MVLKKPESLPHGPIYKLRNHQFPRRRLSFFEIVAKKHASVKRMIESTPEEDYRQCYPAP